MIIGIDASRTILDGRPKRLKFLNSIIPRLLISFYWQKSGYTY